MKEGIQIQGSTGGKGDSIVLTITAQRCSHIVRKIHMYIQLDDGIVFSIVYQTIHYWSNFVSGETIVKTVTKPETYTV